MSPRSQPVVSEIVGWERSPKVAALMVGCWRRDIDGVVCCLRWVKVSWWDLSVYSDSLYPHRNQPITSLTTIEILLIQPTHRSEDPLWHWYCWIVLYHDSHDPLCLSTHVLCLALFFVTITSYCTFISQPWQLCLLSAPLRFRCLHTPYCYLFLANWSVCNPALNYSGI